MHRACAGVTCRIGRMSSSSCDTWGPTQRERVDVMVYTTRLLWTSMQRSDGPHISLLKIRCPYMAALR
jgi:hypothetical protein